MSTTIAYIILNLKRQLSYPINFFGYAFITGFYYAFQFIYLDKVTDLGSGIGGLSEPLVRLIYFVFGVSFLLIESIAASIHSFFEVTSEGCIESHLVKPVRHLQLVFFRWCMPGNIVLAIVFAVTLICSGQIDSVSASPTQWIVALATYLCLIICNLALILILNHFTFLTQRALPVSYIHERVFDLSIVPVGLFPQSVIRWVLLFVPVAVTSSAPVAVLVNSDFWIFAYVAPATLLLTFAAAWSYRRAFAHFQSMGG